MVRHGLFFSLALHFGLGLLVVYWIQLFPPMSMKKIVYEVKLVSVRAPAPVAVPEKKQSSVIQDIADSKTVEKKIEQPSSPAIPEPVLSEPTDPEPAIPEPVLAEPVPSKAIASEPAIPEPVLAEPAPPKPTPQEIMAEEFENMRQDLEAQEKKKQQALKHELESMADASGDIYTKAQEDGASQSEAGVGLAAIYLDIVGRTVKKNWSYPSYGSAEHLTASVEMLLSEDGTIESYNLVKSSGHAPFDDSVLRAVAITRQVPPPKREDLRVIIVNFNLSELYQP